MATPFLDTLCPWCNKPTDPERYPYQCAYCAHRSDLPRERCDCPACRPLVHLSTAFPSGDDQTVGINELTYIATAVLPTLAGSGMPVEQAAEAAVNYAVALMYRIANVRGQWAKMKEPHPKEPAVVAPIDEPPDEVCDLDALQRAMDSEEIPF